MAAILLVSLCVCVMFPIWASTDEPDENAKKQTVTTVLYEENFDDITTRVDLVPGENTGAAEGWRFVKNSDSAEAYIESGKLHLYGNKYDMVILSGKSWSNYTIEADIYYKTATHSSGWIGMMYNVQSEKTFQKAGLTAGKKYSLNGRVNGSWKNDANGVNKGFTLGDDVNFGENMYIAEVLTVRQAKV